MPPAIGDTPPNGKGLVVRRASGVRGRPRPRNRESTEAGPVRERFPGRGPTPLRLIHPKDHAGPGTLSSLVRTPTPPGGPICPARTVTVPGLPDFEPLRHDFLVGEGSPRHRGGSNNPRPGLRYGLGRSGSGRLSRSSRSKSCRNPPRRCFPLPSPVALGTGLTRVHPEGSQIRGGFGCGARVNMDPRGNGVRPAKVDEPHPPDPTVGRAVFSAA